MRLSVPHKPIRFDYGCRFPEQLKLSSFNGGEDFIIGKVQEETYNDAIFFGKIAEFNGLMGKNLWLDTKGAHVVYIIGKRRGGKSFTLGTICEGLALDELHVGGGRQAILVLDTLNIFWTMENETSDPEQIKEADKWGIRAHRIGNLVCYYPRGFKKAYTPDYYREFAVRPSELEGSDWAALFGVDPVIDPIGQLLTEAYEKTAVEGYKAGSTFTKPNPDYDVHDLLTCLDKDKDIQRFSAQTIEASRRYLKAVERLPVLSKTGTDIRDLFKSKQATVLLLRDVDHLVRGLIIGLVVKKIMKLRGETMECEKRLELVRRQAERAKEAATNTQLGKEIERLQQIVKAGVPRGWILIDEAHNYIPQTGIIGSKDPLRKYVNEGRNSGLSIAVTTQQPSGLDSAIRRNADVLIMHSITMATDLDATEGMLSQRVPSSVSIARNRITSKVFEHLVRELKIGYCLISCPNANRIFMARVRPRLTAHGGVEY
jgi:hypothetical protein